MINIFAYGELCKDNILKSLIGRVPKKIKGKVFGYKKVFWDDIGYFGAIKGNGEIEGFILLNISRDELKIIDDYEDLGIYYIREKTKAIGEDGKEYEVYIYLRKLPKWKLW